jgi:hypothetical protein
LISIFDQKKSRDSMAATKEESETPLTPGEIEAMKRLVDGVIRAQGNRFIKELLRDEKIRIGDTKEDFQVNLNDAIESGKLRLDDLADWLKRVEGWGNQHVYLYKISPKLTKELTEPKIRQQVEAAADLKKVWNAPTVLEFPDEPNLTSISFSDSVLRLVWQEGSARWLQYPEKNYRKVEGLDTFEYRAWLRVERRAITRFEAHVDKGLAGLFILVPIADDEHKAAKEEAYRVIGRLMDLSALELGQIDISTVSKNLDQQNLPNNRTRQPAVKTQKSRLTSGGAYIEFASKSLDKAFWEETAVRNVRRSVRTPEQLRAFSGTEGSFIFQEDIGLSRPLRVQFYGEENRIRLWKQMDAEEVWTILSKIKTYQRA